MSCETNDLNRRNGLFFNIPPPRYTPQNPYVDGNITKAQLDMRRKAEILKYNKNSNGRITKTQAWAQVVNGTYQRRTYSSAYLNAVANNIDVSCSNIITYTTGAGIPGPAIPLYLDPNVPLYNYNTQQSGLGIINSEEIEMWRTKYDTNLLSNTPVIYTINIRPPIDNTRYNYTVKTSVGIYLNGRVSNSGVQFTNNIIINASSVKVLYGYTEINLAQPPIILFEPGFKTDISGNIPGTGSYAGAFYLGNIIISNILLSTAARNTYDIIIAPIITTTLVGISTADLSNNITAILNTNLIDYSNDPSILSNNTKRFGTNITFTTTSSPSIIVSPTLSGA